MEAPSVTTVAPAGTEDAAGTDVPCKKRKLLANFFKATTDQAAGSHLQEDQVISLEVQSYFQSETIDPEKDPLIWWRDAKAIYPRLSNLARKYLCIPATSSSSERAFSTSGNIVTCLRASLKPDHVNRLVFLAKNL